MKKFAFSLLFALFATLSFAQVGPTGVIIQYNSGDPCQNPNVVKSFAAVNISTATTTELVAAVAGKTIYMCSLTVSVSGTSPTFQFKTGTKVSTACDTAPTNQSGTYALTSGQLVTLAADSTTFLTGALSGELCLTSGGTTPSIQGNLTYIQQ
jgi:hypothetical protein